MSNNTTGSPLDAHLLPLAALMTVTMAIVLIGNLLLLFVIGYGNDDGRRGRRQTPRISPVQFLILHTCLADILFALVTIMPTLITLLMHPRWFGGTPMCKLVKYIQVIPMYASPFLLVAISADRYQAICRPFANMQQGRYRRPTIYAAIAWTLACVFTIPQLIFFDVDPQRNQCGSRLSRMDEPTYVFLYLIWFNVGAWLVPCVLASGFYCGVVRAVFAASFARGGGEQRSTTTATAANDSEDSETSTALIKTPREAYIKRLRTSVSYRKTADEYERRRVHTVKLTLTIVACNFILWAPFCMINFETALRLRLIPPMISMYITVLGNLNSCVNPWIYMLFNRSHVRRAFCRGDTPPSSSRGGTGGVVSNNIQRRSLLATKLGRVSETTSGLTPTHYAALPNHHSYRSRSTPDTTRLLSNGTTTALDTNRKPSNRVVTMTEEVHLLEPTDETSPPTVARALVTTIGVTTPTRRYVAALEASDISLKYIDASSVDTSLYSSSTATTARFNVGGSEGDLFGDDGEEEELMLDEAVEPKAITARTLMTPIPETLV